MDQLTKRQKQILEFVRERVEENGYAPSYEEIGHHFRLHSVATVAEHVSNLASKGYLKKEINTARSLQLTPEAEKDTYEIPLLGVVAAGAPIEAIRTREAIDIPRDMAGPRVFALRVRGDSMIEDGILDGDYIIVERAPEPRNGDIVIALLDNENVTLKRFYREQDHVRLQPANRAYGPIKVKSLTVQGKVRGVIRKFR